jgi:hypothetical protein
MQSTIYAQFRRGDRIYRRLRRRSGHQAKAFSALTIRRIRLPPELYRARHSARPGARCHGKHRFQVATTKEYPEKDFDLIAFFDCLHDRADPPERQRTFGNRRNGMARA